MVWTCPWYEGGGDGAVNERGAGGGGDYGRAWEGEEGGLGNVPQTIMKRVVLKNL